MANDFEWEDTSSAEDFFSLAENESKTSSEDIVKTIENEDLEIEQESSEETEQESFEEKKEEDLFSKVSEDVEDSEEDDDEVEEDFKNKDSGNIYLLKNLKEKGLIDFELEEGEELSEDLAAELIEDGYDEAIEIRIEEKLEALPEDVKNIVSFALKGGSLNDYLQVAAQSFSKGISEDMDMSDEEDQKAVVRALLAEEGNDPEIVETQLELLVETGKLEMFAIGKYDKWIEQRKEAKEKILKNQEKERLESIKKIRESKRKVQTVLNNEEIINSLKPSKDIVKNLPSYMNDRTVKLANGVTISEMQKELFYELPKNEIAMVQLGILLNSRNEDGTFNFDNIAKAVKTNFSKEVKKHIRRGNTAIPGTSVERKKKNNRSLAEIFNN